MKLSHVMAILSLSWCLNAQAEFYSGNAIYQTMLNTENIVNKSFATGYVTGVADAGFHVVWCPPSGVTVSQVVDIAKNYIEKNPDKRHHSADSLVNAALAAVWPCKK